MNVMGILNVPAVAGMGGRLRAAREAAQPTLSGRELDRLAGRPENLATQIEANPEPDPRSSTLRDYCKVLGITVQWLMLNDGPPPTEEGISAAVAHARAARATAAPV